jgi:uridine phosphorylase
MPYFDATPAALQRMFGIADTDLPDAALLVGQWGQGSCFEHVRSIWPDARDIEEHSILIDAGGRRIWVSVVFGAAMAATVAHFAVKLGARALIQTGSMGGLAPGWNVGDVLVPSLVVGRDGVSRQLSRNKPIEPSGELSGCLASELADTLQTSALRGGTLVSTTSISLERRSDITRWQRSGFAGVEMECVATLSMARHFDTAAAGAFVLIDNIGDDHTFFDLTEDHETRIRAAKDAVLRAAISSAVRYLDASERGGELRR